MTTIPFQQVLHKKENPVTAGQPNVKARTDTKELVVDRLSGKITKEEANYRPQQEARSKETCFECVHYLQPGDAQSACRRIAGLVEASATCDLFAARPHESSTKGEEE